MRRDANGGNKGRPEHKPTYKMGKPHRQRKWAHQEETTVHSKTTTTTKPDQGGQKTGAKKDSKWCSGTECSLMATQGWGTGSPTWPAL